MNETKAKIWFTNPKKHVIEVTAINNTIVIDIHTTKKKILKSYWNIFKFIIFKRKPVVTNKEELSDGIMNFVDEYYKDDDNIDQIKNQVLEDLELKSVDKNIISYIG